MKRAALALLTVAAVASCGSSVYLGSLPLGSDMAHVIFDMAPAPLDIPDLSPETDLAPGPDAAIVDLAQ